MEDENTSHLAESQIDRQLAAMRKQIAAIGPVRTEHKEEKGSRRRIAEALLIGSVCFLFGSLWLLREAVAVLQSSTALLQVQLDRVDERGQRTSEGLAEIRGRVLRGIAEGKDPYATDK